MNDREKMEEWISRMVGATVAQRVMDETLYGYSAIKLYPDGTWQRVDPKDITAKETE